MLPNFKKQILQDRDVVFHNPKGFAEKMRMEYQGREMELWGQMEEEGTAVREKNNNQRKSDNEKSLYQYDKYIWVSQKDFGSVPKRGRKLTVNGVLYQIMGVSVEYGEIEIIARRLNE